MTFLRAGLLLQRIFVLVEFLVLSHIVPKMISPPNWFLLLWQYSKCRLGLTKFSRIGNKEDLHNSLKISSSHILSPALELIGRLSFIFKIQFVCLYKQRCSKHTTIYLSYLLHLKTVQNTESNYGRYLKGKEKRWIWEGS